MSRSGYIDDCDESTNLWRGAVKRAVEGKRGQSLLIALRDALDAMPVKELADGFFKAEDGCMCTLGVLGEQRGIDLKDMERAADYGDYETVADAFGVSRALVQEIMWVNDEANWSWNETRAQRWDRVREWLDANIAKATGNDSREGV